MKPLIVNENSEFYVHPKFFPETQEIIQEILELPRDKPQGRMYGKDVTLNRHVVLLSNVVNQYSTSNCRVKIEPLKSKIQDLLIMLNCKLGKNFNSVLVNIFENGRESLGSISDNSDVFVFLGASRKFRLRENSTKEIYADFIAEDSQLIFCTNDFMKKFRYEIPTQAKVSELSVLLILKEI